jgi:type I restriction enzyme S subunit
MNREIPYKIPRGWIWTTLDELFVIRSGGTPDRGNYNYYQGEIPWVKSGELNYDIITSTEEYITSDAVKSSSAKVFPKGTILIALYGATVGKLGILGIPAATNQAIAGIYLSDEISKYVYYYLLSSRKKLLDQRQGAAQPNISQKILKELPIPIPPKELVSEIVAKIEELFSELDNSEKMLKKIINYLVVYRQSVLKSAFVGELRHRFKGKWESNYLEEIFTFLGGGTPSKSDPSYWNGSINWASVKDIQHAYIWDTADKITENGLANSSAKMALIDDVILITRISPGKVAIAKSPVAINQDLKIVRPIRGGANNKFTYYLFLFLENEIVKLSKGTTVKGIRLNELNSLKIDYPDLSTQNSIVEELDRQNSLVDDLFASAKLCLKRVDAFREIVLKKAFLGTLTDSKTRDSASKLLSELEKEKSKFLKTFKVISDVNPILKNKKKSFWQILREEFSDEPFSIDELKMKMKISDKDLKDELYKLLDSGDKIQSIFDTNNMTRLYQLKK